MEMLPKLHLTERNILILLAGVATENIVFPEHKIWAQFFECAIKILYLKNKAHHSTQAYLASALVAFHPQ